MSFFPTRLVGPGRFLGGLLAVLSCVNLAGCQPEPEIVEYTEPKEAAGRPFSCRIPEAWTMAANDRFSDLAFESATGARVTVSKLNGTGDEFLLLNVNRWRRQVALEPADSLDDVGTTKLKNGEARLVELTSAEKGLKAAIVEHDDKSWIFKLSGSAAVVADQADEFSDFLKSVEFIERKRS